MDEATELPALALEKWKRDYVMISNPQKINRDSTEGKKGWGGVLAAFEGKRDGTGNLILLLW